MVLVGAAAAEAGVPIPVVIAVGAFGAFCGDSTSWYIGHRWGYAVVNRWEPVRRHMEGPLRTAEEHFSRRGGQTVFAARFVGALRAMVPLAAGISGMPYRSFVPWNAAASILWVSIIVTLGAVYGDDIAETVDRFGVLITAVVVVVGVGLFARRRYRRGSGPSEGEDAMTGENA
jgi:undecaprenyl-diphosphatase